MTKKLFKAGLVVAYVMLLALIVAFGLIYMFFYIAGTPIDLSEDSWDILALYYWGGPLILFAGFYVFRYFLRWMKSNQYPKPKLIIFTSWVTGFILVFFVWFPFVDFIDIPGLFGSTLDAIFFIVTPVIYALSLLISYIIVEKIMQRRKDAQVKIEQGDASKFYRNLNKDIFKKN